VSGLPIPAQQYYAGLPKVIAGAGLILHDDRGRVLLVQPAYRIDSWEIPGGALDPGEDPWMTARRETREELDLDIQPGRLLVVDWMPAQPDGRPPLMNFVFDGGSITEDDAGRNIRLSAGELTSWRLADTVEQRRLLSPHMARRVQRSADALLTGTTAYLYEGRPRH
jgi:8-oxo-dGTP pyrophosphatase MutT (NUDIX family)